MTIKSASDFADMRRAGRVVANIHEALREAAKPGVSLLELDAIAARVHAMARRFQLPQLPGFPLTPASR
jgi:methionine aminopeptidase